MEPCNNTSTPMVQTTENQLHTKNKTPIKKYTSLLNVHENSKNSKKLNHRISKSSKNIRLSVKDSISLYQKPPTDNFGETAKRDSLEASTLLISDGIYTNRPSFDDSGYKIGVNREDLERVDSKYKIERSSLSPAVSKPIPTIIERLKVLLEEKDEGKLKRKGDYALGYISTNILYWKEIDKIFLLGFIGEKKAKKTTTEALVYIHNEIKMLLTSGKKVSYQELIHLNEILKENRTCQQVLNDNHELKSNFAHLLKMASLKEPS